MKTRIKGIIFEDLVNYKKPCLTIQMPFCNFKCDKECGEPVCQNSDLIKQLDIYVDINEIVEWYCNVNKIDEAIVFQGLEPFDSWTDLRQWIYTFRQHTNDDIIIYTGYNKNEIEWKLNELKKFDNIIIKYGRFVPHKESHYDKILGIELASPNQYAEVLNEN